MNRVEEAGYLSLGERPRKSSDNRIATCAMAQGEDVVGSNPTPAFNLRRIMK